MATSDGLAKARIDRRRRGTSCCAVSISPLLLERRLQSTRPLVPGALFGVRGSTCARTHLWIAVGREWKSVGEKDRRRGGHPRRRNKRRRRCRPTSRQGDQITDDSSSCNYEGIDGADRRYGDPGPLVACGGATHRSDREQGPRLWRHHPAHCRQHLRQSTAPVARSVLGRLSPSVDQGGASARQSSAVAASVRCHRYRRPLAYAHGDPDLVRCRALHSHPPDRRLYQRDRLSAAITSRRSSASTDPFIKKPCAHWARGPTSRQTLPTPTCRTAKRLPTMPGTTT